MDNLCKEVVFQKLAGVLIMDNLAMVMSELALFVKQEMECKKAHTSTLMLLENVSEYLLTKERKINDNDIICHSILFKLYIMLLLKLRFRQLF